MTAVSVTIVRVLVFVVFLVGLVTGIARLGVNNQTHQTSLALILASAVMIAVFALLEAAQLGGRLRPFGWTSVILGADGRISTSKSSVWLWTIGLSYALLFLAGIQIFTGNKNVFNPTNWNDYLILIGGPFASAVLAKFAVVNQLTSGTLAKPTIPEAANPSAIGGQATHDAKSGMASVFANDSGGLDLVDSQYFLFNIVAFAYAAGVFLSNNFNHAVIPSMGKYALPNIPATLLGLTSAAAATYVGNKAVQKSGPGITSIRPDTNVGPNNSMTITGVNLVPAKTSSSIAVEQTAVWLTVADGSVSPVWVTPKSATPTTVTFDMVTGFAGKTVSVYVVSAGGVPSSTYPIQVA